MSLLYFIIQMSKKVEKAPSQSQSEDMIQIAVEQSKKPQQEQRTDKKTGLASLARSNSDIGPSSSTALVTDEEKMEDRKEGRERREEEDVEKAAVRPQSLPSPPKYNVVELLTKGHTLR